MMPDLQLQTGSTLLNAARVIPSTGERSDVPLDSGLDYRNHFVDQERLPKKTILPDLADFATVAAQL
jgi:hypothetical protein